MRPLFTNYFESAKLLTFRLLLKFLKRLLLFCSPFILLVIIYIIWDPFKVIYSYDYYYQGKNYFINKNRDFISSEMFMKNCEKYHYNSFIFGSSTSLFFLPSSWEKHIGSANHVFAFDASGENLVGIWSKIRYIHDKGSPITHALLVLDTESTFKPFRNKGHVFMKHYEVYPSSPISFHMESLLSFLNIEFLGAFIHRKVSGRYYPYMKDVLEEREITHDPVTNGIDAMGPGKELKKDSIGYYRKKSALFLNRQGMSVHSEKMIDQDKMKMLTEIKDIFRASGTDYRVIISPLYEQRTFHPDDLRIIREIFGNAFVFDFSGINEYTASVSNYYDPHHFKFYVGDAILNEVYGQN